MFYLSKHCKKPLKITEPSISKQPMKGTVELKIDYMSGGKRHRYSITQEVNGSNYADFMSKVRSYKEDFARIIIQISNELNDPAKQHLLINNSFIIRKTDFINASVLVNYV